MKITFLGHASFRIEIADQTLLIDPWLTGNPVLSEDQHQAAVAGATHILLTHAHFDHMADVVRLSKELNVPLVGQYDLMGWFEESEGLSIVGFNKGGTVTLGDVAVTMVNAVHSSTTRTENGLQAMGSECGFMIEAEGRTIYVLAILMLWRTWRYLMTCINPKSAFWPAGGISPWTCGVRPMRPTSSLTSPQSSLPLSHLPHS